MTDRNSPNVSKRRILLTELASVILCLGFIAVFAGKYVVFPMIRPSYTATKNSVTYEAIKEYAIEGDIRDRHGNIILGYGEPGTGAYAQWPQNYSFSWLLGYYSVNSSMENKFGLRGNLKDYSLFTLDANNKGTAVTLTADTDLQNFAYQNILAGNEGSVIVLDNATGAIMCLASQSTIDYDVNNVDTLLASDIPDSQYRRGTFENDPPGSTFKVITAAAALKKAEDEGLTDDFFAYTDTGTYIAEGDGFAITNYANAVYGDIGLEEALNNSVNCYFADLGIRTGRSRIRDMANAFLIGKDIEVPFLDTVSSVLDFGAGTPADIAQVSFGQGNTEISPLHLALIAQAIANDGKMMAPYIVNTIKLGRIPLYKFFPHSLNQCISGSIDGKLKAIMHSTAVGYGLDEENFGYVCAKTGSAECTGDRVHTYIIGFTDRFSFCISANNSDISTNLLPGAQQLTAYLNSME